MRYAIKPNPAEPSALKAKRYTILISSPLINKVANKKFLYDVFPPK